MAGSLPSHWGCWHPGRGCNCLAWKSHGPLPVACWSWYIIQLSFLKFILDCSLKCLRLVFHQHVRRGQQKLVTVDKPQLPYGEGDVLLCVDCNAGHPALHLWDGLYQEVGVTALKVGEDDQDDCGFGVQPQPEITCIVDSTSVLPNDVAVVKNMVSIQFWRGYVGQIPPQQP